MLRKVKKTKKQVLSQIQRVKTLFNYWNLSNFYIKRQILTDQVNIQPLKVRKNVFKIRLLSRQKLNMVKSQKYCFEISSLKYIRVMTFNQLLVKDLKANHRKRKHRLKAVRAERIRNMVLRSMVISYKKLTMCNQRFQAILTKLAILEQCLTAAFSLTNKHQEHSIKDQVLWQLANTLVSSASQIRINHVHWTSSP